MHLCNSRNPSIAYLQTFLVMSSIFQAYFDSVDDDDDDIDPCAGGGASASSSGKGIVEQLFSHFGGGAFRWSSPRCVVSILLWNFVAFLNFIYFLLKGHEYSYSIPLYYAPKCGPNGLWTSSHKIVLSFACILGTWSNLSLWKFLKSLWDGTMKQNMPITKFYLYL